MDDPTNENTYNYYMYFINLLKKYDLEIYDKTPDIHGVSRPGEIYEWITQREDKDNISFISLDDDYGYSSYEKYHMGDRLINTEFFCDKYEDGGLQQNHVDMAIKKFLN